MLKFFSDPVKDARTILESIDYRLIRAAWELYAAEHQEILQHVPSTPAWRVLTLILGSNGDPERLNRQDVALFKSFPSVSQVYGEIIKMIEEQAHNSVLAEKLFKRSPELHDAIPAAYDNPERVYDILTDALRGYQRAITDYAKKHEKWLKEIGWALERV